MSDIKIEACVFSLSCWPDGYQQAQFWSRSSQSDQKLYPQLTPPLFIKNCILLWCDWILENWRILIKSRFFDRSVLSDNQGSTPLSYVDRFTVGFSHWRRIYANHRIRIVQGRVPLKVLGLHLIKYYFLGKAWPGSNNHSIMNGSEYRDKICYFSYRWSTGPAHSFSKFIPFIPKLK